MNGLNYSRIGYILGDGGRERGWTEGGVRTNSWTLRGLREVDTDV